MIIKFWDNEDYDYPLIQIKEKGFEEFKALLKTYSKDDDYNWETFLEMIKNAWYFEDEICVDEEVFF